MPKQVQEVMLKQLVWDLPQLKDKMLLPMELELEMQFLEAVEYYGYIENVDYYKSRYIS